MQPIPECYIVFSNHWYCCHCRIRKKHMQEEEVGHFLHLIDFDKILFTWVLTVNSINLAPWTFDPSRFLKCLQTLREEVLPVSLSSMLLHITLCFDWSLKHLCLQGSVYAPSFDHGVGDPVENDIFVKPQWVIIADPEYILFVDCRMLEL